MADYNKKGELITLGALSIPPNHPAQQVLEQYRKGKRNVKKSN